MPVPNSLSLSLSLSLNLKAGLWHGDTKLPSGLVKAADSMNQYGMGSHLSKPETERIVQQLVMNFVFEEETQELSVRRGGNDKFSVSYIKQGTEAENVFMGRKTIQLEYRTKTKKKVVMAYNNIYILTIDRLVVNCC